MNQLDNGTLYRATNEGYLLERGQRRIYIIAKSVNSGTRARQLMTSYSFDKLFKKGKQMATLGNNISYIRII